MLIDGTKQKEDQLQQKGGQPVLAAATGGTLNASTGSSINQAQNAKGGAQSRSGNWTNMQDYIAKNQAGSEQNANKFRQSSTDIANLGRQIVNNLGNQYNQTKDNFLNSANTIKSTLQNDMNKINTVGDNFMDLASNQDTLNRMRQIRRGTIDPASEFNPVAPIQNLQNTASQLAPEIQRKASNLQTMTTEGGLVDWLGSVKDTGRRSRGGDLLDKFFLTQTDPGVQAIQGARQEAQALPTQFNQSRENYLKSLQDTTAREQEEISKFGTAQDRAKALQKNLENTRKNLTSNITYDSVFDRAQYDPQINEARGKVDSNKQAIRNLENQIQYIRDNMETWIPRDDPYNDRGKFEKQILDMEKEAQRLTYDTYGLEELLGTYQDKLNRGIGYYDERANADWNARYNALAQLAEIDPNFNTYRRVMRGA